MAAGKYQSFPGAKGASQSDRKLERLSLPNDLKGKSILDIGCNEGFFCQEAARRGATRVVGIDQSAHFVDAARSRSREFSQIEYIKGDAKNLPDEKFDVILVLSVIHYFENPYDVFCEILSRLKPDGILILECGVADGTGKAVKRALRSIDERFFPTIEMLRSVWLKDFAVRYITHSVSQAGDPIPRMVFHCSPLKTNVILIPGDGGIGKTTLSLQLEDSAIIISTDSLLQGTNVSSEKLHASQKAFDEAREKAKGSIRLAWNSISQHPEHRAYFVDIFSRSIKISRPAPLIVVEGYSLQETCEDVVVALGENFRCWSVRKI